MRHSCTISSRKPPEKLIRQHLFPLSIFDLIITHKLTRPIQKQKLRGKEKRNRKEGSRCKPGRNKKSDMLNLEIAG